MTEESQLFSDDILPPKRSTFLTVLCVLTFLGSTYGIFGGITSYTGSTKIVNSSAQSLDSATVEAKREQVKDKEDAGSKFAIRMMESAKGMMDVKKIKTAAVASILANLITLTGAILMWRLNRKGFYVYIAGIGTLVAGPLVVYGTSNMISVMTAIFYAFFGIVFIVMYAFNLKDMKPTPLVS